jgi:hypothetical protein
MMSPEKDFEDFLFRMRPWKVDMELEPIPARDRAAAMYQLDTDALLLALRSGDRVRLEAALLGVS